MKYKRGRLKGQIGIHCLRVRNKYPTNLVTCLHTLTVYYSKRRGKLWIPGIFRRLGTSLATQVLTQSSLIPSNFPVALSLTQCVSRLVQATRLPSSSMKPSSTYRAAINPLATRSTFTPSYETTGSVRVQACTCRSRSDTGAF